MAWIGGLGKRPPNHQVPGSKPRNWREAFHSQAAKQFGLPWPTPGPTLLKRHIPVLANSAADWCQNMEHVFFEICCGNSPNTIQQTNKSLRNSCLANQKATGINQPTPKKPQTSTKNRARWLILQIFFPNSEWKATDYTGFWHRGVLVPKRI